VRRCIGHTLLLVHSETRAALLPPLCYRSALSKPTSLSVAL